MEGGDLFCTFGSVPFYKIPVAYAFICLNPCGNNFSERLLSKQWYFYMQNMFLCALVHLSVGNKPIP